MPVPEDLVRLFRFAPIVICALVAMADAATAASTFLPPVGQTARYRFSDTVIGGKGTKTLSGTLTLLSVTEDRAQLSIAIDGKAPRTFNLHVDATGALDAEKGISAAVSPTDSRAGGQALPGVAEQALILQLSLASRAGAHPADVESFPVLLDIPWARAPVNPILKIRPTGPDAFAGDAEDTTTINPPGRNREHILRNRAIAVGVGIVASQIDGGVGRVVGPVVTLTTLLIASRTHSGDPQPADVSLHITGQLAGGRLQTISCDEEYVVHPGKHAHTFGDRWSLTAVSA